MGIDSTMSGVLGRGFGKGRSQSQRRPFWGILALFGSSIMLASWSMLSLTPRRAIIRPFMRPTSLSKREWRWSDLTPSRNISWSSCYDDFQCARLDVPMDWLDPSDEKRVVIAVIKYPAKDVKDYKGAVFTNPGGPSGSGVEALLDRAKPLHRVIGINHDLISFDPRGVGASTPPVECWSSKEVSKVWSLQDSGDIDSHPGVFYDVYARSFAESQSCIANAGEIIKFVSTTSVARDMLEIVNQGGYEKLRYWGFSYGTVLGGMFAALFPNKVERLISDGNVDYREWTTCAHRNAMHDTDEVMQAFFTLCHKAGPVKCAIYADSPLAIEERLLKLQARIKTHPIIVYDNSNSKRLPEIISYSSLRRLISTTLYQPLYFFAPFAKIVAALEAGDGKLYLDFLTEIGMYEPFSECEGKGRDSEEPPLDEPSVPDHIFRTIMCTDGGGLNETAEEFKKYADYLMKFSKAAGAVGVLFRMACVGWSTKAKWAYSGPFEGNTSHPILYLANKADNVTPLRSARENAKGFKDSAILIQNSYGHTSLSAPSLCTGRYIRDYFQKGTLPPAETQCEADLQPFDLDDSMRLLDGEDLEIWTGLVELSRAQANFKQKPRFA